MKLETGNVLGHWEVIIGFTQNHGVVEVERDLLRVRVWEFKYFFIPKTKAI